MKKHCDGCGKVINPKTLICDACGTDYNEKPQCNCLYSEVAFYEEPIQCCRVLLFKCKKCGNVLNVPVSETLIEFLGWRERP